jgi:hypothetical protein
MVGVIGGRKWRVRSRKSRIEIDISGREDIEMVHADGIYPKIIVIIVKHGNDRRSRICVGGDGSRIRDGVVVSDGFDKREDRGYCGR